VQDEGTEGEIVAQVCRTVTGHDRRQHGEEAHRGEHDERRPSQRGSRRDRDHGGESR
jgi:hypothetical protein